MGVISRQVLPFCGSLCFFCPSMRARSRQPVKRYKKLLADIFPRSQDEEPNDRNISKLCTYASKNPLRIPKITSSLEQRCYKELRLEHFQSVKIVMCIYRKLLITCKEQMPLFASSLLSTIHILLDQTRHDDMRITGCQALFEFVNNQSESTYMLNLDGMIPKICLLAQEAGDDMSVQKLRAAGLQALSSLVWFMGEFSHISAEFDNVVSVVLENYEDGKDSSDVVTGDSLVEVVNPEGSAPALPENTLKVPSWRRIVIETGEASVSMEDAQSPKFWSRVCLHNMAKLAKEVTTVRRVLESLFRYFDSEDLWSPEDGVALSVLLDMQLYIEDLGQNTHLLLSILIKHLDHKNVLKQPNMQIHIVNVATSLAKKTKVQASVAIIGAFSDMMRHLRKSIHCSLDDSKLGDEIIQWNRKLRSAVDECLVQLSLKVGDAGPLLDMMALMLESIPNIPVMARTMISAVYRTAQIVAAIPNLSYQNKAFPEALFHQLLVAMVCSDYESRLGAHQIFSIVLVPSSVCPQPTSASTSTRKADVQRTLSRTVSVFSSSAALFGKLGNDQPPSQGTQFKPAVPKIAVDEYASGTSNSMLNRLKSTYSRVSSRRHSAPLPSPAVDEPIDASSNTQVEANSLRLSSRQILLLLSSIWAQSISPLNTPENYEAIAHTYSLVLLFSRTKSSSNEVLVRSFQLALSLRTISLAEGGPLQASRCRSLFTLATSMIIFTSKAFNILPLVGFAKDTLTKATADPYLQLIDDCKLVACKNRAEQPERVYGSKEDDEDALKSLAAVVINETQTADFYASMIVKMLGKQANEATTLKEQLLNDFLPDDVCPLGSHMFNGTPRQIYQFESKVHKSQDSDASTIFTVDDDVLPETSGSKRYDGLEPSEEIPNLISVNQLLDSVGESTHHVGRISVSSPPDMSYKDIASHCEALLVGKQQKMSNFISTHQKQDRFSSLAVSCENNQQNQTVPYPQIEPGFHIQNGGNPFVEGNTLDIVPSLHVSFAPMQCATEFSNPNFFRLPASSPYDNFLKAAGC
uniref:ARM repeat superfamily protein n=1 Tax=Kalanchoe fedtschenkoi TaxID=63787 RepID=A0A7N0VBA1_KALFE